MPSVGADLDLGRAAVTWVVTAYTLVFGGLMVFGGRLSPTRSGRAGCCSPGEWLRGSAGTLVPVLAAHLIGKVGGRAVATATLANVPHAEAGVASGVINTFHELGGSIGVTAVSTVAATDTCGMTTQPTRRRADAERNIAAILAVAGEMFGRGGVPSMGEVAAAAAYGGPLSTRTSRRGRT